MKLRITIDGKTYEAEVEIVDDEEDGPAYTPYVPAPVYATAPAPAHAPVNGTGNKGEGNKGEKVCRSPVTGLVIKVNVEPGQTVVANDLLVVLEAMKMETQVSATHAGTVKSVNVTPGSSVKAQQVLVEFE